jgi:type IV pilus secretin PilQ/predicted competence protein
MKNVLKAVWIAVLYGTVIINAQAAAPHNLTFKDTDIKVVLQAITQLAKSEGKDINIVPGPAVTGTITIDLSQVDWETALNVICRSYNLDTYRQKNVIIVTPLGPGGSSSKSEIQVKVFTLKYIDANDALKAITPILSSSGKTSVLETTGQSGWEFSTTEDSAKRSEAMGPGKKLKRTKVLVVSDGAERLERISGLLEELDVMPKQILIKTRILEVSHDVLKDLGVDWGTGPLGAADPTLVAANPGDNHQFASHSLSPTPSMFLPQTQALTTLNGGGLFGYRHLSGTQFEVILHALEENSKTNTLSAPILMTLNNQEATILVGTKFPIIQTTVSTTTNNIIGGSLQEYKDIGIQLNVVPQIWGDKEDYINLIVHPAVSSFSTTEKVIDQNGTTLVEYPIISTREAETQLIIPDNGTVMMGGLLKDVKNNQIIGVPFFSKIPMIGSLFDRNVHGTEKVELVIFITAHIMAPGEDVSSNIIDTTGVQAHFEEPVMPKK